MSEEKPADVLSKVLSYVDSPFKLFALILMAVFAFCGYFVWQNQELLVGAYKESKKMPSIVEDRVEDAAAHLLKTTNATVVAVFKVNPMFGTRVLYRAYTKEGRDKTNDGLDVGLFTQNQANNADVIKLMASEIPCGEYKSAQSDKNHDGNCSNHAFKEQTMIGLDALLNVGGKLIDKLIPDPEAKAKAQLELAKLAQDGELAKMANDTKLFEVEQENISDRWKADMGSDSWLSKNIRPMALIAIFVAYFVFTMMSAFGYNAQESYVQLLGQWGQIIFLAYFGGRTVEKLADMRSKK
jgi:hypothetical protein